MPLKARWICHNIHKFRQHLRRDRHSVTSHKLSLKRVDYLCIHAHPKARYVPFEVQNDTVVTACVQFLWLSGKAVES
jgi:hypothetical protein